MFRSHEVMKFGAGIAFAGALATAADAGFVRYVVCMSPATSGGQSLLVYNVYAEFSGPTDTMLNFFNLGSTNGAASLTGFWHKDNASYNSAVLSQQYGTWNPSQTGSNTANRPFDSYLTIGGIATGTNTSNADPSWVNGGNADARSWNRPDLPNNGTLGWFNSLPPNLQGRVGTAPNTATDVRVGQFVLSQGDTVISSATRPDPWVPEDAAGTDPPRVLHEER